MLFTLLVCQSRLKGLNQNGAASRDKMARMLAQANSREALRPRATATTRSTRRCAPNHMWVRPYLMNTSMKGVACKWQQHQQRFKAFKAKLSC